MKLLAFTLGVLVLTAGAALAASESGQVQKPQQEFKALTQVVAPISLTDEQLAKIEGQGIVLANPHATPGLPFPNPGTAIAVGKIPSNVGQNLWFGKAAGK